MKTPRPFPPFFDSLAECQDIVNDYLTDDHYIDGGHVLNDKGERFYTSFLNAIDWGKVESEYEKLPDKNRAAITNLLFENQRDNKLTELLEETV